MKLFLNYFHQMSVNEKIEPVDYNIIVDMYRTKEEVNSMMLTAIRKEKERLRKEGREEGRQEGLQEGRQEGLQKGVYIKAKAVSVEMIKKGFDIKLISELSGLSIEEIEKLKTEL